MGKNTRTNKILIHAGITALVFILLAALAGSQGAARFFMGFLVFPAVAFADSYIYSKSEDFGVILPVVHTIVATLVLLIMRLGFWIILTLIITLIAAAAGSYLGAKNQKLSDKITK